MARKIVWNKVTTLSKTIALITFVSFPFIGFYLGVQYQKKLDKPFINNNYNFVTPTPDQGYACTMEAKLCPDGSYVGRHGPKCEFEKCPGE